MKCMHKFKEFPELILSTLAKFLLFDFERFRSWKPVYCLAGKNAFSLLFLRVASANHSQFGVFELVSKPNQVFSTKWLVGLGV